MLVPALLCLLCVLFTLTACQQIDADLNQYCTESGGVCAASGDECGTDEQSYGWCAGESVCCLPNRVTCVQLNGGFCTSDPVKCARTEGHVYGLLRCSGEERCCEPGTQPSSIPGYGFGPQQGYQNGYHQMRHGSGYHGMHGRGMRRGYNGRGHMMGARMGSASRGYGRGRMGGYPCNRPGGCPYGGTGRIIKK